MEYLFYLALVAAGFGLDRVLIAVRSARQPSVVMPAAKAAVEKKAKRPYVRKAKPAVAAETVKVPDGYVNGAASGVGAAINE